MNASPPRGTRLALLVDRDEDTRRMYAEYLKIGRWRVDEAADGREALAKALSLRPDVVVTETRLTGIDGFELCGLLRRDIATAAIPLVVVTADAFSPNVQRAIEAGADLVLTKPCLPERLLSELHALIARGPEVRSPVVSPSRTARQRQDRADELLTRAIDRMRRGDTLKKAHLRGDTNTPPVEPPRLVCPACDRALRYQRSHVGGVSSKHPEQWDYYECEAGCGTFQYRTRTRKLRRVV